MKLPVDLWYPVLESREVRRTPLGVERLGQQLVFWRDDAGLIHAHPDRCPHLGASLSGGKVDGDSLVCPFHGFEFNQEGNCVHIPAHGRSGKIPGGMALKTFPLKEAHGFIWLWLGSQRNVYPEVPFFPVLESGWGYGSIKAEWPVHYTRAIENQLDVAHLAFVHRSTIGAGGKTFVDGPYVETDDRSIRVWVSNLHDPGRPSQSQQDLKKASSLKDPGLHFIFPGIWLLNISGRIKNLVAFVPINERKTLYYVRTYHRIHPRWLAKPFEWVMGLSNRYILEEDRRVVVTQRPMDSGEADHDRVIGADRAIIQFRRIHQDLLARGVDSEDSGVEKKKSTSQWVADTCSDLEVEESALPSATIAIKTR